MADERIDIEITDKVDANIEKKIIGIATASDKGFTAVQKLKAALKDVNTTAVSKLAAASNSATNALARELNATAKLTIARSREAEATARMAVQAQKLATEQAKTAAATLRAQTAADKAAASKEKEASAARRLTSELEREANAQKRVIHDRTSIPQSDRIRLTADNPTVTISPGGGRSSVTEQTNSMRRTTQPVVPPGTATELSAAAAAAERLGPALDRVGAGADRARPGLDRAAEGAGLARHQMVNLGYQLQDIVVSLQAGQNPLTVFIQQGSQIIGIAAASGLGFKAMAAAVWSLIAPFTPLIAVLAAAYFGFKQFTSESGNRNRAELEAYSKTLGLTSKEMRKLGNDSVDANGKLKSFNTVTITMGDSWNGFIATVKEGLSSFAPLFEGTGGVLKTIWNAVITVFVSLFRAFYGVVLGGMKGIARIIMNLPSVVANTASSIANAMIGSVEFMLNAAITGINGLVSWASPLLDKFGVHVGQIGKVSFGRFARSGKDAFEVIGDSVFEEMGNFDKTMAGFSKRWDRNNVDAAKKRMKAAADAIIGNRNPKAGPKPKEDHTAENRAHALDMVNLKLDDELKRMKLLKPEREIQQRYDAIEAELAQKKIKLNDAEKTSIMGKVRAIEAYKFVQAESDRIYESAIEPLRTYNATIQAATELLAQGAISQAKFNEEVNLGTRKLAEATDPLFNMKEAMDQNTAAAGLYGRAVEQNTYAESVRQTFLAKGIDLTKNATAAQQAEANAIIAKNNALLQQQFIQSQVGAIVNPILENQAIIDSKAAMYAEIDRLEAQSVITHQQHEQAKHALDAKFSELRLAQASSTFGALAQLSASGNSKLAAIGKAAAVAQATIDGYVAVQKALASGPPPFNFIQAAAVGVMTGVQVAGILNTSTNVGNFAQGGQFMVDGRAGVDNNNVNMNLSRGERVTVETAAQQRAADGGSGSERPLNVKVVNVTDPKDIEAALADPDNDHLVLNVLRRNPGAAKQLMNGGR